MQVSLDWEILTIATVYIDEIDPSIKERFNPCIFLAEFLMRNNPQFGTKLEYTETFNKFARIEKLRRFFTFKRQKIFKHFTQLAYSQNFNVSKVDEYVRELDAFLKMNNKLIASFKASEQFADTPKDEVLAFETFYDRLKKWAVTE